MVLGRGVISWSVQTDAVQAIANQGMTHGGNIGSKHPGTLLNGISEEGQDTSAFQSEPLLNACGLVMVL